MPYRFFQFFVFAHRCKIPGLDTDSYSIQDDAHNQTVSLFIPKGEDGETYDSCLIYKTPQNQSYGVNISTDTVECDSFVYDDSQFISTTTSQVCDFISLFTWHTTVWSIISLSFYGVICHFIRNMSLSGTSINWEYFLFTQGVTSLALYVLWKGIHNIFPAIHNHQNFILDLYSLFAWGCNSCYLP